MKAVSSVIVFALLFSALATPPHPSKSYSTKDEDTQWVRGVFHLHGPEGELNLGRYSYMEILEDLRRLNFDFGCIISHDAFLPIPQDVMDKATEYGITLFAGSETRFDLVHFHEYEIFPDFDVLQHPTYPAPPGNSGIDSVPLEYWERDDEIGDKLRNLTVLEVYNGWVKNNNGEKEARADSRWDELLSLGYQIYGMADEDAYLIFPATGYIQQVERSFNMVEIPENSGAPNSDSMREAIVDSISSGKFYASTGIEIEYLEVTETEIDVSAENANLIQVFQDGEITHQIFSNRMRVLLPESYQYMRVSLTNTTTGATAWVQPVFGDA